ncbi:MAG: B12-binding domain-containing radical SAM protein [Bacteroidetes bacterium]|nr:B12-binding domain-containing radical SAM protein [Bacteroidota bacterium]
MANVLISNTYFLALDPKQQDNMQPYPPLGALYAAAVLERDGHHVEFIDTIFEPSAENVFPRIQQFSGNIFFVCDDGFNYLTKMCLVNMRNACYDMIAYAKQNNYTVIVSSSDATDHSLDYLQQGADFIIIGEVEVTLQQLINTLQTESTYFESINGIAYLQENKLIKTISRPVLTDLDNLPFPAWKFIQMKDYQRAWLRKSGYFSLNMTTTRGCPFKCNWCAKPIYGNRYNSRSPEKVVEEIDFLISNYQVEHIWFCDDIFGLKPGWIKRFSELVVSKNLQFKFKIQCRADLLLDDENIQHLANAGCDEIWIGAESGSQKILDAMDKGTTVKQIYTATRLMQKHGIKPCLFLQFGYLDELQTDIDLTIKMVFDLMPYDIGVSVSYPLPGTQFYEKVKSQLQVKQNWSDSDELLLMYKSTYSPAYYKQLHRYIHKKFRLAQGKKYFRSLLNGKMKPNKTFTRRILTMPVFLVATIWHKRKMDLLSKQQ